MKITHVKLMAGKSRHNVAPVSLAIMLGIFAAPITYAGPIVFTNDTDSAGISFQHVKNPDASISDPTIIMGAGAVWFDYDNDGHEDLYATQGSGCNHLFHNDGDGSFTEVTDTAGVGDCDSVSNGAVAADYDNDGWKDLLVLNVGQNRLFRNNGDGTFIDTTATARLTNPAGDPTLWNPNGASWGDIDGDGRLDLYIGNYVDTPDEGPPSKPCQRNLLFHNDGGGKFSEVGIPSGVAYSGVDANGDQDGGCTLSVAFSDYDRDGDPDIIVNNDFGLQGHPPNALFRNDGGFNSQGGWQFTDVTVETGMDFQMFGMGIAVGDVDNDQHMDYFFSNMGPDILARNTGQNTFVDIASGIGMADKEFGSATYGEFGAISWGNGFADFNLDGYDDLAVAHGGAPPDVPMFRQTVDQQDTFVFQNNHDGTFTKVTGAGLTDLQVGRGLALADYDNDGDVDIWVGNIDGTPVLWRNDTVGNNWLKVGVVGTVSAPDALNTFIVVRDPANNINTKEVVGGSSFNSMHSLEQIFGLSTHAQAASVVVTFPSGLTFESRDIAANQRLVFTEPVCTTTATPKVLTLTRGEPIAFSAVLTNHTNQSQTFQHWIERILPDGTRQETVRRTGTLKSLASTTINKSFPTNSSTPLGNHTYIMKLTQTTGELIHQEFVDVAIL